jgi:hypothetical protein
LDLHLFINVHTASDAAHYLARLCGVQLSAA